MIANRESKLNSEVERHHHESCKSKENSEFEQRVQARAYEIYKATSRDDSNANFYQALNELRRGLCDCEEFRKTIREERTRTAARIEENIGQAERAVPEREARPEERRVEGKRAEHVERGHEEPSRQGGTQHRTEKATKTSEEEETPLA